VFVPRPPLHHPPRRHFSWPLRALAFVLRRFAVLVAIVAVWQRTLLRRRRRTGWQLRGDCKSCGRCCDNFMLPSAGSGSALVRWLRAFWHEGVFDFYPRGWSVEGPDGPLAAYGCRNLTADRRCARYGLRPFVCRAYPALALYERPAPRAHCGFVVIDEP
jgi:hypothetical protein